MSAALRLTDHEEAPLTPEELAAMVKVFTLLKQWKLERSQRDEIRTNAAKERAR